MYELDEDTFDETKVRPNNLLSFYLLKCDGGLVVKKTVQSQGILLKKFYFLLSSFSMLLNSNCTYILGAYYF